jgi:transcriptional regulator with XRE-family HTH domain
MIEQQISSPFTDGKATLHKKVSRLPFRKEEFEIVEHYYVCDETREEFTTKELDRINLNQVYNQYRKRFGLPFPDQIKSIRQKYALSASKMSEILGLGANTYRLYEQGEIPSIGNGRLIMAAEDPVEFRKFLLMSKEVLGEKEFNKLDPLVGKMIDEQELGGDLLNRRIKSLFNQLVPDEFTGYRLPNLEKISHMIIFFSTDSHTWKTSLNKLLFYCDFFAFKNTGFGISGLAYRAIPYGPSPSKYEDMYDIISMGELVRRKYDELGGYEGSYFEPLLTFNELLFDSFELDIMHKVSTQFKYLSAKELKNLSHKERAWIDNIDTRRLISYKDYGFYLQTI